MYTGSRCGIWDRRSEFCHILSFFSSLQSTTHVQHRPNGGTTYLYEWSDTSKKVCISIYKLLSFYQLYTFIHSSKL